MIIRSILLEGKIPCLLKVKRFLFWLAWLAPFSIFFFYGDFRDYAEIGWIVLVGVLTIRPLASVLPDFKILTTLVFLRREFGIFSGMMITAHFTGYLIVNNIFVLDVFTDGFYWEFGGIFLWGIIGVLFAIPVLLTSNKWAMSFFKAKWKGIQRLSYLFLMFGGLHIFFVGEESGVIGVVVVVILWLLARFRVQIRLPKRIQGMGG